MQKRLVRNLGLWYIFYADFFTLLITVFPSTITIVDDVVMVSLHGKPVCLMYAFFSQVAGGDGTVGWVLGCLGELNKRGRLPIPSTGVIPLGTGNDLSRSFGWVSFHMHINSLFCWFLKIFKLPICRVVHSLLIGNHPLRELLTRSPMVLSLVWIGDI